MRPLRILMIAYPLLPVSDESCGGAEQMLWLLERELHRRGHHTTVAACNGSKVSGELFATGEVTVQHDALEIREREHIERTMELIEQRRRQGRPFDLIHDKSGMFWKEAGEVEEPVLATMHLPFYYYSRQGLEAPAANLTINCVSQAQSQAFAHLPHVKGFVRNGIALERFPMQLEKDDYLLWMGRICLEKGPHIALEIAERTGMPIKIVGQVYPFTYHQEFFDREVRPRLERLGDKAEWVQTPSFARKVRLLQNAKALLVPSLVDETSSLVAKEAMACGTPVVAFRRGALPEVVIHGRTGILVNTIEEMISAVQRVSDISPAACAMHAQAQFSAQKMALGYERLYQEVLIREDRPIAA